MYCFPYGFTDWSSLMTYILVFCADDVDLRKLHKWFLRHPWKRYLNFDESSFDLNVLMMQQKLFLHNYINKYSSAMVIFFVCHTCSGKSDRKAYLSFCI